jgi:hypothetical protein
MIFKSLKLTEGMATKFFDFSKKINLVHSEKNSRGKTTLLRFLLYSIGFSIPSTKNIKFDECITECVLDGENGTFSIVRTNDYMEVICGVVKRSFVLPHEANEFHSIIFGTNNKDILNNILGTFYVDQERMDIIK